MTPSERQTAQFNRNDHAIRAGWASYMKPLRSLRERLHGWFGHTVPSTPPDPANGYSPSNYAHCPGCGAALKWFVVGQHRYGSIADTSLRAPL